MSYFDPKDPERWKRGIDFLNRVGGHAHIPLLEAARDGELDLVFTGDRHAPLPFGKIRRSARPVLILLGDDDYQNGGPAAWRVAQQVTRWCHGAIVHGAGAERKHYEAGVFGTRFCGRFLMVDTASRYVRDWMGLLGHVQALAIMPREGSHPLPIHRETMH